jgi:HlyD family secretion protein
MPGPAVRPTPLPKRPKGRLFVGGILIAVFGTAGYAVWNSLLRYDAYGTITGRVIHVSALHGGNVRGIHVREGDYLPQGRLLMTLENLELGQKLERVKDELLLAQANLDAELSRLHWQAQQQGDQAQRAAAEYLELWGDLVQQQARLDELQARFDRHRALGDSGATSQEQLDESRFALEGQRAKVARLNESLVERKKLADDSKFQTPSDQLKPLLVKIEVLQAELSRLRDLIGLGQIRAPVGGRVIRALYYSGERVEPNSVVMEILEEGSLEAVVYLPQDKVAGISKGQTLQLQVPQLAGPVESTIERFGEQYMKVPDALERHYRRNESVLPVFARLNVDASTAARLQLGCELRLPAHWPWQLLDPLRGSSRSVGGPAAAPPRDARVRYQIADRP